jgi:hypothetical protein
MSDDLDSLRRDLKLIKLMCAAVLLLEMATLVLLS